MEQRITGGIPIPSVDKLDYIRRKLRILKTYIQLALVYNPENKKKITGISALDLPSGRRIIPTRQFTNILNDILNSVVANKVTGDRILNIIDDGLQQIDIDERD